MNPSTSPERQDVINMTIDTIGKDMLSAMVDELRNQQDVWQKLSEDKQGEVIERLTKRVKSNVQTAVHLTSSHQMVTTPLLQNSRRCCHTNQAKTKQHNFLSQKGVSQ